VAEEFALMAESAGAKAVTLHARTTEQAYSGQADWAYIARVKERVQIPVIGNGDIFSGADAHRMLAETRCDGVMIARGAKGNPWIFREVLSPEEAGPVPIDGRIRIMLEQIDYMQAVYPERVVVLQMRKHIQWYLKGLNRAAFLREEIYRAESIDQLKQMVRSLSDKEGMLD
jgi:tRNA-dihydrouridine synthase